MKNYVLFAGFAILCSLSACKCTRTATVEGGIDTKNVENIILEQAKAKGITSVTCPPVADGTVGSVFICSAQHQDGTTYKFEVKVTGDNGQIDIKDIPNAGN